MCASKPPTEDGNAGYWLVRTALELLLFGDHIEELGSGA